MDGTLLRSNWTITRYTAAEKAWYANVPNAEGISYANLRSQATAWPSPNQRKLRSQNLTREAECATGTLMHARLPVLPHLRTITSPSLADWT